MERGGDQGRARETRQRAGAQPPHVDGTPVDPRAVGFEQIEGRRTAFGDGRGTVDPVSLPLHSLALQKIHRRRGRCDTRQAQMAGRSAADETDHVFGQDVEIEAQRAHMRAREGLGRFRRVEEKNGGLRFLRLTRSGSIRIPLFIGAGRGSGPVDDAPSEHRGRVGRRTPDALLFLSLRWWVSAFGVGDPGSLTL